MNRLAMTSAVIGCFIFGSLRGLLAGGLCEDKGHRLGWWLLLGRWRVIAATRAGRVAGFAGGVFEVVGHGDSPKNAPEKRRARARGVPRGRLLHNAWREMALNAL